MSGSSNNEGATVSCTEVIGTTGDMVSNCVEKDCLNINNFNFEIEQGTNFKLWGGSKRGIVSNYLDGEGIYRLNDNSIQGLTESNNTDLAANEGAYIDTQASQFGYITAYLRALIARKLQTEYDLYVVGKAIYINRSLQESLNNNTLTLNDPADSNTPTEFDLDLYEVVIVDELVNDIIMASLSVEGRIELGSGTRASAETGNFFEITNSWKAARDMNLNANKGYMNINADDADMFQGHRMHGNHYQLDAKIKGSLSGNIKINDALGFFRSIYAPVAPVDEIQSKVGQKYVDDLTSGSAQQALEVLNDSVEADYTKSKVATGYIDGSQTIAPPISNLPDTENIPTPTIPTIPVQ